MNGVFIIPTGIGCEIGGHAGDANPAAKLIASVCDKLIVHPNVVNASDINEMTENMLYVEGSMLDRFLEGEISLREVKSNKILVVVNPPIKNDTINAVSAARATIGADIQMIVLDKPLVMKGWVDESRVNKKVGGEIEGWEELVEQVKKYDFDVLAITTPVDVGKEQSLRYWEKGRKNPINPWGYVEAMLSKLISKELNKPVAHSPVEADWVQEENYKPEMVDPRMSAEMVSVSYLHCILKGLWRAPRSHNIDKYGSTLCIEDIDFMVSPYCWGQPHFTCLEKGIPIIMVTENLTIYSMGMEQLTDKNIIWVNNYLEALGVIQAMKIGVTIESVTRPLKDTIIH